MRNLRSSGWRQPQAQYNCRAVRRPYIALSMSLCCLALLNCTGAELSPEQYPPTIRIEPSLIDATHFDSLYAHSQLLADTIAAHGRLRIFLAPDSTSGACCSPSRILITLRLDVDHLLFDVGTYSSPEVIEIEDLGFHWAVVRLAHTILDRRVIQVVGVSDYAVFI